MIARTWATWLGFIRLTKAHLPTLAAGLALVVLSHGFAARAESLDDCQARLLAPQVNSGSHGLAISWFGAASVLLDDGSAAILIDPFVSRANNGPFDILLRRKAEVDMEAVSARASRAGFRRTRALLVSHSHYDHVLDVAAFAGLLKAPVFGSPSSRRIVEAHGYRKVKTVRDGDRLTLGGFRVTVFPGVHGRPPMILDPLKRSVSGTFRVPASVNAYGRGEVHTYFIEHRLGSVLHIGSAGVAPGSLKSLEGKVDVLLLSLVGRGNTKKFLEQTVGAVKPRFVIPIHYDNLFKSLDKGLEITPLAGLKGFFAAMDKAYPQVKTGLIDFDVPWTIPLARSAKN